ncbi:MAG TPA: 1-deoxy-D-xylulose-5-phosphate reductoisomerase [Acidimicrobiales bacterium]|nr:1-deoxy-D-xylulose-5-phosphate reductoisomerase [Acidimicrobiales bacterium]
MATTVAVLGSTGSVGTQALEVIAADPGRYEVVALGAARSVDLLVEQAHAVRPKVVAIADASKASELQERVPAGTEVVTSLADVAHADVVLNAVVGFAGLPVTLAALEGGHRLALANKESLIAAGPLVQTIRSKGEILPVDSEHSAIHQCLRSGDLANRELARLVITASGGPFRGRTTHDLQHVTVADALAHPTWSMGPKITVDSSTLMNKGLEVIEAHELFGVDYDDIDVVVHPQSIIHSMVEWTDGSTIAQLSNPDMRLPVEYALTYPQRGSTPFGRIDWATLARLDFEAPDTEAFPCLRLAYEAGRAGGSAPAWLNAANEVAVQAFLDGAIPWVAIAEVLEASLALHDGNDLDSVDVVLDVDRRSRLVARNIVEQRT